MSSVEQYPRVRFVYILRFEKFKTITLPLKTVWFNVISGLIRITTVVVPVINRFQTLYIIVVYSGKKNNDLKHVAINRDYHRTLIIRVQGTVVEPFKLVICPTIFNAHNIIGPIIVCYNDCKCILCTERV